MADTTGNQVIDPLADAIAERVVARLRQAQSPQRLISVRDAAVYLGRTPHAIRHMIAEGTLPSVRSDKRVFLDREDLDRWIELRKARG